MTPEQIADFATFHRGLPHDDGVPRSACWDCRLLAHIDTLTAAHERYWTLVVHRLEKLDAVSAPGCQPGTRVDLISKQAVRRILDGVHDA